MASQKTIERFLQQNDFTMIMGDIDLTYGQTWIRDNEYYFDIIEIVDLDSAAGASGQILVEAKTTSFDYLTPQDHKSVQSCMDCKCWLPRIARGNRAMGRLAYAADIASYGIADEHGWNTAIFDRSDYRDSREKWGRIVPGWGYAAIQRAIDNAMDWLVGGYVCLPHELSDGRD